MVRWLSLILLLIAEPVVSIRTVPRVFLVNTAVRVYCRVPHRAENRTLTIELENYRSSGYDLDGENAPQLFERLYEHVPCEVTRATCSVVDALGKVTVAATSLQPAGCSQP